MAIMIIGGGWTHNIMSINNLFKEENMIISIIMIMIWIRKR